MDTNLKQIMDIKVKSTIESLEKNNMNGYYVHSIEALHEKIKSIVATHSIVSVGGSVTLSETGVLDLLRNGNYEFLDRYAEGMTPEKLKELYRKSFSADAYFSSTNAITVNGELYNVDGSGNRVASMIYGPDKVIVVVGTNKIVKDIDAAIKRNREISAPANCLRLNKKTPCAVTGTCSDCKSPDRICCAYTIIGYQNTKNRIHVIFIDDSFGF